MKYLLAFQPPKIDFTFFSDAHGIFSRIDHILGHKSGLGKFLKMEIISSIFSDHSFVRLDSNYRKKKYEKHKHMEAKQYTYKEPTDHWRIKKEIKIWLKTNDKDMTT